MSEPNLNEPGSSRQNAEQVQNPVDVAVVQPDGQPAVFKLDADCWDEVFDLLPVVDVLGFGRTCKAFHWVAGEYFRSNLPAINIWADGAAIHMRRSSLLRGWVAITDYIQYVQRIRFFGEFNNDLMSKFKELKHLHLERVNLNGPTVMAIRNVLNKIETISLIHCPCEINGGVYENLLQHCTNLEHLKINDTVIDCLPRKFPETLQRLEILGDERFYNNELNQFFELNPNVRNLGIDGECILANRRSLMESNIKLDNLTVKWILNKEEVFNVLKELHGRGFYQRLHFKFDRITPNDQLTTLRGLTTLHVSFDATLPSIPDLKELGFNQYLSFLKTQGLNVAALPQRFIGIERLIILRASVDDIMHFIRHSRNLKEIEVKELEDDTTLDISALNKEREQLNGAQKMVIYVEEHIYLVAKEKYIGNKLNLIEIQRSYSYKTKQDHNLRADFL